MNGLLKRPDQGPCAPNEDQNRSDISHRGRRRVTKRHVDFFMLFILALGSFLASVSGDYLILLFSIPVMVILGVIAAIEPRP